MKMTVMSCMINIDEGCKEREVNRNMISKIK